MTQHLVTSLSNTTSTRLSPSGTHSGTDITIQNIDSSAYVYIGSESVTSTNFGFRIPPDGAWSVELNGKNSVYAISDTSGSLVAVLMTGLEAGN